MPAEKYTRRILAEAVEHSSSMAGVLRYLGLKQSGGGHAHISRRIKRFGIDTSHFVRFTNGAHRTRLSADQVLVRRSSDSPRAKPYLLRRALAEINRPLRCEICDLGSEWQGQPLLLEIDHIDGDFHNNERDNLRYLCPNCHAQTPTWCGRNVSRPSLAGRTPHGLGSDATPPSARS
ncbi:HNH endonuclease signature motif containing protein [Nocardioides bruguierae]|uniref:HNH endonuclease signature motif containing protein n=1 Tax=Nocardioides bruguierae TaxID=2945102 RepID=UPI00202206B4|nr:HNH endonuclease signature motif containing protein [Nocardioides bruguierae]MCL8025594.1 HNH endonuclease [Nocardioides bruguierae]